MTIDFRRLSSETLTELRGDVEDYAEAVGIFTREQLSDLLGSSKRAERLITWVRKNGNRLPLYRDQASERADSERLPRILIVGDTHCEPGQDFRRFKWLARLANDTLTQPDDVLLLLGDHYDMSGLLWKQKPLEGEGKRFLDEKQAGDDGRDVLDQYLEVDCRKVLIPGNHGWRVHTWIQEHPYWEHHMDLYDQWDPAGWEVAPIKGSINIHGFKASHYVMNGMQKAIHSVTGTARKALMDTRYANSLIFGHSHHLSTWYAGGPRPTMAIEAGCYFEHHEAYAGDRNSSWWRGVILASEIKDGIADLLTISMDTMQRRYGD